MSHTGSHRLSLYKPQIGAVMTRRFAIVSCLLLAACPLKAQTLACPPGSQPYGGGNAGWVACTPVPDRTELAASGSLWETRWGAIATGIGAFGAANDLSSKRKAAKEAIKQCKANGGKKCSVQMTFYNQCGALAWGDAGNTTFNAHSLEDAEQSAVAQCQSHTRNCRLYYSACSYPKQIR
jgi:Domain of unknown function (DUF4189)